MSEPLIPPPTEAPRTLSRRLRSEAAMYKKLGNDNDAAWLRDIADQVERLEQSAAALAALREINNDPFFADEVKRIRTERDEAQSALAALRETIANAPKGRAEWYAYEGGEAKATVVMDREPNWADGVALVALVPIEEEPW